MFVSVTGPILSDLTGTGAGDVGIIFALIGKDASTMFAFRTLMPTAYAMKNASTSTSSPMNNPRNFCIIIV